MKRIYQTTIHNPDYLGNTEFITDAGGYPYQFLYYNAFGESLVQQNANTGNFATPNKFNAKLKRSRNPERSNSGEQDPEPSAASSRTSLRNDLSSEQTGNYYYGARYYNPQTSIWFGVDPLAAKYPHLNPYNFVEGNPIMLVDSTGMSSEEPGGGDPPVQTQTPLFALQPQVMGPQMPKGKSQSFPESCTDIIAPNPFTKKLADELRNKPLNGSMPNLFFGADAIAIDGGVNFIGQEYDAGLFFVLSGDNAGMIIPYKESAHGGGPSATVGIEVGRVDYFGSERFNVSMLNGPRDKWQADVYPFGEGFSLGLGFSYSIGDQKNKVYTTIVSFSFGATPEPFFNLGWNRGKVKPW